MEKQIIAGIISRMQGQKIIKIKPIVGKGDVNQIFVITLETKKVLLRINSKEGSLDEFKKEVWCIKKAKGKGVLAPNILGVGKYKGYSFMVYEFIEGKSGEEIKNRNSVWVTLGEYANKVNSINVKGYGLRFSPEKETFLDSWERYISYNIESLNESDKLLELKVYNKTQLQVIRGWFIGLKKKRYKIGVVHNDLSLRNVVVGKEGKVFLIDWGCAEANIVPYAEFVEILGAGHMDLKIPTVGEINSFLEGYGISKKQFNKLKKEISKFLLLVSFDKVRWAVEKSPKDVQTLSRIARKRLAYALKINR